MGTREEEGGGMGELKDLAVVVVNAEPDHEDGCRLPSVSFTWISPSFFLDIVHSLRLFFR